jgi:hypothetical protein
MNTAGWEASPRLQTLYPSQTTLCARGPKAMRATKKIAAIARNAAATLTRVIPFTLGSTLPHDLNLARPL